MLKRLQSIKPPCYIKPRRDREQAHYKSKQWSVIRRDVLNRDANVCRSCGRVCYGSNANVDHIVPLEQGGTDDMSNLQTLCRSCHGRKTITEQRGPRQ